MDVTGAAVSNAHTGLNRSSGTSKRMITIRADVQAIRRDSAGLSLLPFNVA